MHNCYSLFIINTISPRNVSLFAHLFLLFLCCFPLQINIFPLSLCEGVHHHSLGNTTFVLRGWGWGGLRALVVVPDPSVSPSNSAYDEWQDGSQKGGQCVED